MAVTKTAELLIDVKGAGLNKLKKASKDMKTLGKNTKETSKAFSGLGADIAIAQAGLDAVESVLRSIAQFSQDAVMAFANFDDGMRKVGAVSNATQSELDDMTKTAKELGATTRFTALEASKGLEFLAMAGLNAADATEALPGVLNLAAANTVGLGEAADIVTNVMSGYGKSVSDISELNDILTKATTSSNLNLTMLAESMKKAGPAGKAFGQDILTTVQAIMAFAQGGIKGTESGTAFASSLARLSDQTAETKEALEKYDINVLDSSGNLKDFIEIIEEMREKHVAADDVLRIFGKEHAPKVLAILNQSTEAVRELGDELSQFEGTTDRIAEEMEAGLGGAIRGLDSAWEGFKMALGEAVSPELEEFLRFITEGLREIIKIVPAVVEAVKRGFNAMIDAVIPFRASIRNAMKVLDHFTGASEEATEIVEKDFSDMSEEVIDKLEKIKAGEADWVSGTTEATKLHSDALKKLAKDNEEALGDMNTNTETWYDKTIDALGGIGKLIDWFVDKIKVAIDWWRSLTSIGFSTGGSESAVTTPPPEARRTGGPIGFNSGGFLGGYGGGDRIRALLEAGEFVIRKEAVKKYGTGLFSQLNDMKLPDLSMRFSTGGLVPSSNQSNTFTFNTPITATGSDAAGMENMFRNEILPKFIDAMRNNSESLTTQMRQIL